MKWLRSVLLPAEGSQYARQVDDLYMFIVWLSVFFFVLIAGLLAFFIWRYRRRGPDEVTPHITHNFKLELTWSIIPLILVTILFVWGFHGYVSSVVPPKDALEIQVTAKRWLWEFEYPNGSRTINEMRVPVGKPVKLIMSSADVIHSFYIPSFRIKMDVLPNRYTQTWFEPLQVGTHVLFCAEYCGRAHSDMLAKVTVLSDEDYRKWLEFGDETSEQMPLKELGAMLHESRGCDTCHSLDGSAGLGTSFKGVFGTRRRLADGQSVEVDENYLRESILEPQAKLAAGYQPIMPTFQGLLREREISALIEFIKAQR